jgi:MoaA/NifB/PqqE/SkfB family radical SAM enzyme
MWSNDILADYQASRDQRTDRSVLCHAPYVSLNFEQNGNVTACCYNRSFVLGTYPRQSVSEIWNGASARALREAFLDNEEAPGCDLCFHQLQNRNFGGVLMRNFDQYSEDPLYRPALDPTSPRVLEFEIANTCNLECVMCTGYWSSSIRAHREQLPPLHSPYDELFVEQLEQYLPSVKGAKFLGGEPFLIERYYDIWERFARLNPDAQLAVTTNATFLPKRARALLEELRVGFAVSLDGFTPETYESIRQNARFDAVMANVNYLLDLTHRRGTELSIAICPMTYNWREIPALLEFCEERKLGLHFNMVLKPAEASLGGLPAEELAEVIEYLERVRPSAEGSSGERNRREWEGLLSQLRGWHRDKVDFVRSCSDLEAGVRAFARGQGGLTAGSAVPRDFQRLLPAVVRSYRTAQERSKTERVEFLTLLPPTPSALLPDGQSPTTAELLLAAHLFCRFLADREAASVPAQSQLDHQRLLSEYVARRGEIDERWAEELGAWLLERLRTGATDELIPWIEALVEALEGVDEWQRGLRDGMSALQNRGLDETEYRTVAAYFDLLVERFFPHHPEGRRLDLRRDARVPPIRDLMSLRRVLDALYLFHCCYEPTEDHAVFRRRLESCVHMIVESGKTESACRSFEAADPKNVYRALARASEEELQHHLESLA